MTTLNDLFADSLRTHMTKRNITIADFAERCDVTENTVYRWRRGEASTLDSIAKAAHVLKVHPAALLGATKVHTDYVNLWERRPRRRKAA